MLNDSTKKLLLKNLKIDKTDNSKNSKLIESFDELIKTAIVNFTLEQLNDEQKAEFFPLLINDLKENDIILFARKNIPNFDNKLINLVKEEIKKINY